MKQEELNSNANFLDCSMVEKIELALGDTHEVVVEDGKTFVVRKKPQYPKTYEECFNICFGNKHHIVQVVGLDGLGDNKELFESFIKLKICRDAYWKLAGEQMGLGKPWEPDYSEESYEQGSPIKYVIYYMGTYITKEQKCTPSYILTFPTEETRDAFYKNFKEEIENCKELL